MHLNKECSRNAEVDVSHHQLNRCDEESLGRCYVRVLFIEVHVVFLSEEKNQ